MCTAFHFKKRKMFVFVSCRNATFSSQICSGSVWEQQMPEQEMTIWKVHPSTNAWQLILRECFRDQGIGSTIILGIKDLENGLMFFHFLFVFVFFKSFMKQEAYFLDRTVFVLPSVKGVHRSPFQRAHFQSSNILLNALSMNSMNMSCFLSFTAWPSCASVSSGFFSLPLGRNKISVDPWQKLVRIQVTLQIHRPTAKKPSVYMCFLCGDVSLLFLRRKRCHSFFPLWKIQLLCEAFQQITHKTQKRPKVSGWNMDIINSYSYKTTMPLILPEPRGPRHDALYKSSCSWPPERQLAS